MPVPIGYKGENLFSQVAVLSLAGKPAQQTWPGGALGRKQLDRPALIVMLRSASGRFTRNRRAIEGGNRFASLRFVSELHLFLNREAVSPHSPGSAAVTPRHPG